MDCLLGALVVATSMGAFILLLWLREQIVIHGGPDWLNNQEEGLQVPQLDGIFRARFLNRVSVILTLRTRFKQRRPTYGTIGTVCEKSLNASIFIIHRHIIYHSIAN